MHESVLRPWEYFVQPFPITDQVYYVGNRWVGSFLIDTGDGLMLIDCGMPQTMYQVLENIRALGFEPKDIRTILITHAHYDHCGAAEAMRQYTGAKLYMGREDAFFLTERPELMLANEETCPLFHADCFYEKDTPVCQGNIAILPVHTPGHTPGTYSLFFDATVQGKKVRCGMHGGLGFNTLHDEFLEEYHLPKSLRRDFYENLLRLRDLPVDLTIGSHPGVVSMLGKQATRKEGENPFLGRDEWKNLMDRTMKRFQNTFGTLE